MRRAAPTLLLLLLAAAAAAADNDTDTTLAEVKDVRITNDTVFVDNENGTLVLRDVNGTVIELDGNPEEVVRKKRTFGDIVFRGLADVLGYSVARKPPQTAFPPPLAPVPGIDAPQAAPAPAPATAAATAPCGQPRAAAPPPCAQATTPAPPPPQPKAVPPCPKPRAAPRPKPKPTRPPPPPPPPPCAQPRANPTTPAPCTPAPPPPPPPKQADNLERINTNFRLNFNFNRSPVSPATPAPAAAEAETAAENEAQVENQQEFVPLPIIPIEPRAAKLPQTEPRKPRVYVDAFVVRNGVARRVDTVDAKLLDPQRANVDEDYLAYDDDAAQQQLDNDDDYEDVQESRDRDAAVQKFGNAVNQFWNNKRQQVPVQQRAQRLPANHYQNVHFGDRNLADEVRYRDDESHQSLQRERAKSNRIPLPLPEAEAEDDAEITTTTEDPKKPLKPRVLPPTEHNPNQIDTVTVRVPPIYREKRPRKLHRERPEQPDREEEGEGYGEYSSQERGYGGHEGRLEYNRRDEHARRDEHGRRDQHEGHGEHDADGDDSSLAPRTERPRRKRRRKQSRVTRAAEDDRYSAGDFDYYGNKRDISEEEKFYLELTVPPPTVDADVARHEKPVSSGYFLEDHERLREDPSHRIKDDYKSDSSERADESERSDDDDRANDDERADEKERSAEDKERSVEDKERAGEEYRADSRERTDKLSPNARVRETVQQNNYVRATNVQVDDPSPPRAVVKRKVVRVGKKPAT